MKPSNKLLLILFLLSIIFVGSIPVTLRYKIRRDDFIRITPGQDYDSDRFTFGDVNQIVVRNISDCTIIPSDSFHIEIEKSDRNLVTFAHSGDTLLVAAETASGKALQKVRVYVRSIEHIYAIQSTLVLRGSLDHLDGRSFNIYLTGSKLTTRPASREPRVFQFIDSLTVAGRDSASLEMSGAFRINKLRAYDINEIASDNKVSIHDLEIAYTNKTNIKSKSSMGEMAVTAY